MDEEDIYLHDCGGEVTLLSGVSEQGAIKDAQTDFRATGRACVVVRLKPLKVLKVK